MKVIFLDFDGVLNSVQYHVQRVRDGLPHHDQAGGPCLDPAAVKVLNGIVERTGAVVVVSSTWRRGSTRVQLASWLSEAGFEGIVLGKTPHLGMRRGHEIQQWLGQDASMHFTRFGLVTHFVILDDDTDMEHLYPKLVHIDDERGLTEDYVPRILSHLEDHVALGKQLPPDEETAPSFNDEMARPEPIGTCPRCQTPVYTTAGFCGVCHPERL